MMGKLGKIFTVAVLAVLCSIYKANCFDLKEEVSKVLVREARSLVDGGDEAMTKLQRKIDERTLVLQSSTSNSLGINYQVCADIRDKLSEGQKLLVAGKQLYSEITTEYNKLTGCFANKSKYDCWSDIIEKLPNFLTTYKSLVSCYVNNVYYTGEMIDYDFYICIGSTSRKPKAPPKTYEQCLKDGK